MAIHDVDATLLIYRTAEVMQKEKIVYPPVWAQFVKTGMSRERPPVQANWWYVRSAAILRKIFLYGPIGVNKMAAKFGGRRNRGYKPEHYFPGATNHIRKILQQLEKAGLIKQVTKDAHKGRVLTPKGMELLESVASEIMKEKGIVLPAKPHTDITFVAEEKVKKKRVPAKKRAKSKVQEAKSEESEAEQTAPAN